MSAAAASSTLDRIVPISADSHIVEPDNCYRDNIESKYRDRAPRIEREEHDGHAADMFVIDGVKEHVPVMTVSSAGRSGKESFRVGTCSDAHQGGWDPKARLQDQDRDGVGGEILYPSLGMVLCSHPDDDYKQACMSAYNRWLQQYVSEDPTRLFGIGQTAVRSVDEAVRDMESMKAMGFKGIMLPGFPAMEEDYSDEIFDPLWEASVALEMPVCFHILTTSRTKGAGELETGVNQRGTCKLSSFHNIIRGVQDILSMFIFDRVFDRHQKLKVVCTEADAGWVPHFMARADHAYKRFEGTLKVERMSKLPSEFFKENIYVTFQDDWTAFQMAHLMNPERLMWANDFPHSDSTWPNSQDLLAKHTAAISDDIRRRILRDNVVELYQLPVAA